jgi:hypothetical protein
MNDQFSNEDRPLNEGVAQAAADVKETVREAKDKFKAKTKEMATQARERGEEYVRENKERAAERIGSVGKSIRQTADRLEEEKDPNIAHYTRLVADKLEGAANYIRQRDLGQLKRDGEDLARQHPAVFFGGMFVAGLAAARFLKASAERENTPASSEDISGTEEEAAPADAGTNFSQYASDPATQP